MPIIARASVPTTSRLDLATTVIDLVAAPGCPRWCAQGHPEYGDGQTHESLHAQVPGLDPAMFDTPASASVWIERTDDDNPDATEPSVPARLVLAVTEGAEDGSPGFEGTQAWTGTPEQAEALAAELMRAARIVRAAQGGTR